MKTILLPAAASLMLLGAVAGAHAESEGNGEPFGRAAHSTFVVNVPAVDTGSQAYPTTQGYGADTVSGRGLQWNMALLNSPDTGSEQMPVGLR